MFTLNNEIDKAFEHLLNFNKKTYALTKSNINFN